MGPAAGRPSAGSGHAPRIWPFAQISYPDAGKNHGFLVWKSAGPAAIMCPDPQIGPARRAGPGAERYPIFQGGNIFRDQKSDDRQPHEADPRLCRSHPVRAALSTDVQYGRHHDRGPSAGGPGAGVRGRHRVHQLSHHRLLHRRVRRLRHPRGPADGGGGDEPDAPVHRQRGLSGGGVRRAADGGDGPGLRRHPHPDGHPVGYLCRRLPLYLHHLHGHPRHGFV